MISIILVLNLVLPQKFSRFSNGNDLFRNGLAVKKMKCRATKTTVYAAHGIGLGAPSKVSCNCWIRNALFKIEMALPCLEIKSQGCYSIFGYIQSWFSYLIADASTVDSGITDVNSVRTSRREDEKQTNPPGQAKPGQPNTSRRNNKQARWGQMPDENQGDMDMQEHYNIKPGPSARKRKKKTKPTVYQARGQVGTVSLV